MFSWHFPTCWCHTLISRYMSENSQDKNQWGLCFLCTVVRFHAYLFIFIHGKTLFIFLLSLTHPPYVCNWGLDSNKIHGSIHIWVTAHWGKSLDTLPDISPRYLPASYSHLIISPFLSHTSHHDRVYLFLTKSRPMEKRDGSNVGEHQHFPFAAKVSNSLPFPSRTVLPEQP